MSVYNIIKLLIQEIEILKKNKVSQVEINVKEQKLQILKKDIESSISKLWSY